MCSNMSIRRNQTSKLRRMIMNNNNVISVLLTGIGGQGILLASDLLTMVAMEEGYDVKKSEVHGMSQRGGSVESAVRFGKKVYSPILAPGMADFLLSFEKLEALRTLDYLNDNGLIVVNDYKFDPLPVAAGLAEYPGDIIDRIKKYAKKVFVVDGMSVALRAGSMKVMNVVLIGAISKFLPFKNDAWLKVIKKRVPEKYVELNIKAFKLGSELV